MFQELTMKGIAAGDGDRIADSYGVAVERWAELLGGRVPTTNKVPIESLALGAELAAALEAASNHDIVAALIRVHAELEHLAGAELGAEIMAASGIDALASLGRDPRNPPERARALVVAFEGRSCPDAVRGVIDEIAWFFDLDEARRPLP